ncbi:MAG: lipocalin family protein [FCB group bacterium]|nr:lipocalin family protein [FCB group bacterium]
MSTGFQLSAASANLGPLKTVDKVNLDRFMGDWYVIASIPTMFEKRAVNAVENYSWNEKGYVDVTFTYYKDDPNGKLKTMTQKGFIQDTETNAEWKVQPIWPLKFGYLVIDLDSEYSYTVIGVPNRKYVWIMARESSLDATIYQEILERLEQQGYDTEKLQMVPQRW